MPTALDTLIDELHSERTFKTWSLIISFFGDSIEPRGGTVSAACIQLLMSRLRIGNGAVRTALSRLASDGWVTRTKVGRTSFYSLTTAGQEPFRSASKQIYAPVPATTAAGSQQPVVVAFADPQKPAPQSWHNTNECHLLDNHTLIAVSQSNAAITQQPDELLVLRGTLESTPEWLHTAAGLDDIAARYKRLQSRINALTRPVTNLDAIAARTLLIHEWRRILLREKAPWLSGDSLITARNNCHHCVAQFYNSLNAKADCWLDQYANNTAGSTSTSASTRAQRFTR